MFSVRVKDVYVKEAEPVYVFVCEKKVRSRNDWCFLGEKINVLKRVTLEIENGKKENGGSCRHTD